MRKPSRLNTLSSSTNMRSSTNLKMRSDLARPVIPSLARVAPHGGTGPCRWSGRILLATGFAMGMLGMSGVWGAAMAHAAPAWRVDVSAAKRVSPGGKHTYLVRIKNIGDAVSDGTGGLDVSLPPGVTGVSAKNPLGLAPFDDLFTWSCGDPMGASSMHCDLGVGVSPGVTHFESILLTVSVGSGVSGILSSSFAMSGGGAQGTTTVPRQVLVSDVPDFGVNAFDGSVSNATGGAFTQAGGHPYEASTTVEFNTVAGVLGNTVADGGALKDAIVDLPAGFVGNPAALPACSIGVFLSDPVVSNCSESTQLGFARLKIPNGKIVQLLGSISTSSGPAIPLYNLEPPPGVAASFGFTAAGVPVLFDARVTSKDGYHVQVVVRDASQTLGLLGTSVTLWGTPAHPTHDPFRVCAGTSSPVLFGCAAESPPKAFLSNPATCGPEGEGLRTGLSVDSWAAPGVFESTSFVSHNPPGYVLRPQFNDAADPEAHELTPDKWGRAQGVTGCESLSFNPSFEAAPNSSAPDSPTGLEVNLRFPQDGLENATALRPADLRRARVVLADGLTISPSAADGLKSCSDAEIGIGSDDPVRCPDGSKIGTVAATTPLLKESLEGGVYVGAQQSDDPESGRMFRIFLVLENKQRGVRVKLAGQVRVTGDDKTGKGQLETIFDNNPQVPVSTIALRLKTGARAPLATPLECGRHTVTAQLTSWAGHTKNLADTFTIDCPSDLNAFSPLFSAGSVSPTGGAFSPFVVRIDRPDRQQLLVGVSVQTPGGILAKLKGVPLCSDADANAGKCPIQSRVGTATVSAGPGPAPFYIKGPISLTGPYRGAPYGLAVAVRAIAGPFDLGTVVVRQAINVDPVDAHLTVISDPLPVVVKGVPVRVRSVNVDIDRPSFTANPTSCAQKHIAATFSSIQGATSTKMARYQLTGCAALRFTPRLTMALTGKSQTGDGKHPGLKAHLSQPKNQANIKAIKVALPLSLALDPKNATSDDLCEFEEGQKTNPDCPKSSIIGKAKAVTPLLNNPLSGNVYFVKNVRIDRRTDRRIRTLPTLLLVLRGEVQVNVRARTAISKNKLVSIFPAVPDAPVTQFDLALRGGTKGILITNGDICRRKQTATVSQTAHNNRHIVHSTAIEAPCKHVR